MGSMVSQAEAAIVRRRLRDQNKVVVFTNGVFDLLHVGHVRCLQAAHGLGDVLIVGLNSDRSVRQIKGPSRPLTPQAERAEVLSALECVNYVVVFDDPTAERLVALLQPDVYAKGGDYANSMGEGKLLPEAQVVRRYGGRVEILPYTLLRSTSRIVNRMVEAECIPSNSSADER